MRAVVTLSIVVVLLVPMEVIGHSYDKPNWQVDDACLVRRALEEEEVLKVERPSNKNLRSQLPVMKNEEVAREKEEKRLLYGYDYGNEFRVSETLGPFHLKLYWELGYCWQEEMIERLWCMECAGQTCEFGDKLVAQVCDECDVAQRFEYVPSSSFSGGQIRVANSSGNSDISSLCWTNYHDHVYRLEECRTADREQIFDGFVQDELRFTISPYLDSSKCMTQAHHPKPNENIFAEDCVKANNTRWWLRYWEEDEDSTYNSNVCGTTRIRDWDCEGDDTCNQCEGDCDQDEDCKGQLRCQLNAASEPVPGCAGTGEWGRDYCYDPKDRSKELLLRNYICSSEKMCDACQGKCNFDSDCHDHLKCRKRLANEDVPGCVGTGAYGESYCYDPSNSRPILQPTPQPIPIPTPQPTPILTLQPTPIPAPHPIPTDAPVVLPTVKSLVYVSPECEQDNQCNECEGDCDQNGDCAGDLICFQRSGFTTVPGCSGSGIENKDYCILPNQGDSQPTPIPAPHPIPTDAPVVLPTVKSLVYVSPECEQDNQCNECEGDCDQNGDCAGDLICFQRSGFTTVPGCSGSGIENKDYCILPNQDNSLVQKTLIVLPINRVKNVREIATMMDNVLDF
eukprot:CAMPEP_0197840098 /NCGR_PEP_ID=MMETSP1437-20131217/45406_1 /TAXON_ID=49252 ORGANISM="Eucampia antarctica, Strain CCMP1452" /NCGR_SAMPLE_ID=MMETSP1437 /ASSEMBLY_ACC=CAM_ASM_001096 /LENGTH=622 /DNA_ID=CAMNT_0043449649 /DNA_START=116 /DNA_END=1985 /DNA_ORIENTATION=+